MYLLVFMMCIALATPALAQQGYPAINLTVANTLPDYHDQYPNTSAIKLEMNGSPGNYKIYAFGTFVAGDVQLAEAANSLKFQSIQDVTVELKYPSASSRAVISRMEVFIKTDSKPYSCYVTSIGVGNSSISTWFQSKATDKFEYTVRLFGHLTETLEYTYTEIQIGSKIKDYLEVYPNATVTHMNGTRINSTTVRFWLGNGGVDHLVSTAAAEYSFPIVQDVALTLEYPQIKLNAAKVTYVEVLLTESNVGSAKAYFISGGLSKDYVKVWILSKNSTVFNYDVKIYGVFI